MTEPAPFCYMVHASGAGEIWQEPRKMTQFGWRCGTNETGYTNATLCGNWSEDRHDVEHRKVPETLQSQYGHNFETTYGGVYNKVPRSEKPDVLKNLRGRHSHTFPGHQPEFDCAALMAQYNSWATTYRADYIHPDFRRWPTLLPETTQTQPLFSCECKDKTAPGKVCYDMASKQ